LVCSLSSTRCVSSPQKIRTHMSTHLVVVRVQSVICPWNLSVTSIADDNLVGPKDERVDMRGRTCKVTLCALTGLAGLSASSCKHPGSRSPSPSNLASSSGSPSLYSSLRRPFFRLAEVKEKDAAAATVTARKGIGEPEPEPDTCGVVLVVLEEDSRGRG